MDRRDGWVKTGGNTDLTLLTHYVCVLGRTRVVFEDCFGRKLSMWYDVNDRMGDGKAIMR